MLGNWIVRGALALALVMTACGDDDDEDAGAESAGDVEAYCAAVAEIESTDDDPTIDQVEAIRAAAPEEIRADIDVVADAFIEGIESGDFESIFANDDVTRRLEEVIEPFEEENCPNNESGDDGAGEDEDEGAAADDVDPAFADYCTAAAVLDEQEDLPSEEQLRDLIAVAPPEIAEDVTLAGEAIIERGEDAFGEDEVNAAIERIEAFETEQCGLGGDEETDDLGASDELEVDAQRVDVTAVEYDFEFQAPAAGRTSFVLTNAGEESHQMYVVRLAEGVTFEEAFAAEGEDGTVVGEADSDAIEPGGEEAVLTIDLEPGEYGMLCFISSPDGEPHADLGMAVPFTVA